MNILQAFIVDDHAIFRQGLTIMLNKLNNVKVIGEAENGEVFIESIDKYNPDIVFLDIKMPKLDGIDVLREIRNSEEFKFLPVVMLTSSSMDRDIMESYELGVNAYVVKPVEFSEFITAIKHVGIFWAIINKTTS